MLRDGAMHPSPARMQLISAQVVLKVLLDSRVAHFGPHFALLLMACALATLLASSVPLMS